LNWRAEPTARSTMILLACSFNWPLRFLNTPARWISPTKHSRALPRLSKDQMREKETAASPLSVGRVHPRN